MARTRSNKRKASSPQPSTSRAAEVPDENPDHEIPELGIENPVVKKPKTGKKTAASLPTAPVIELAAATANQAENEEVSEPEFEEVFQPGNTEAADEIDGQT